MLIMDAVRLHLSVKGAMSMNDRELKKNVETELNNAIFEIVASTAFDISRRLRFCREGSSE